MGGLEVDLHHPLNRLDLRVSLVTGGETLALVGPSGAGKTSVLRAIAGLLRPRSGRIRFDGRTWWDSDRGVFVPAEGRGVGVVFQRAALFPHLSVEGNVAYGASRRGPGGARQEVGAVLQRFGIGHLASARPRSLSAGEGQRVALARAVASQPRLLLLDEPLAALDVATRADVGQELWRHLDELGLPAILVSHDFEDVLGLADRVAVMEAGRLVQVGTPGELLQSPASAFVAALTGVNYFPGTAVPSGQLTEVRSLVGGPAFLSAERATGPVGVVVAPWDVAISTSPVEGSARNALEGPVTRMLRVGNRVRVTVGSRPPIVAEVTGPAIEQLGIAPGVRVVASWKATGTKLVPRPRGQPRDEPPR